MQIAWIRILQVEQQYVVVSKHAIFLEREFLVKGSSKARK